MPKENILHKFECLIVPEWTVGAAPEKQEISKQNALANNPAAKSDYARYLFFSSDNNPERLETLRKFIISDQDGKFGNLFEDNQRMFIREALINAHNESSLGFGQNKAGFISEVRPVEQSSEYNRAYGLAMVLPNKTGEMQGAAIARDVLRHIIENGFTIHSGQERVSEIINGINKNNARDSL